MNWFKRQPPPAEKPKREPLHVVEKQKPKDEGIEVHELDATDVDIKELQSRTGMQRVFDRVTGRFKG